jgi:Zn-dependent peptidase ImmA (M78 family)
LAFTTIKQWIAFINAIPILQYYWIERHADEFAGQLLMPTKELCVALDETVNDAERLGLFSLGLEEILEYCCRSMHNDFGVSFTAMQTRIRKSPCWPHPKVAKISN